MVKKISLINICIMIILVINDISSPQEWISKNTSHFSQEALRKIPFQIKALVGAPREYLDANAQYMEIKNIDTENPVVGLIVQTNGDKYEFEASGAQVSGMIGNIYSIQLPLDKLNEFAQNSNLISMEPSIKCELKLDKSLPETRANETHQADYSVNPPIYSGYSGEDVLVVTIDTGIDWNHEDFIDDTHGTSRILYLWDQTLSPSSSNVDKGPDGFPYGVEYTQEDINDEIDGSPSYFVRSRDYLGHGTHVMGIMAGDGSATGDPVNYPAYTYVGMAPSADLIAVKSDLYTSQILDGIAYACNKAEELNKPVVINLSLGTQYGAHDGSSLFEQAINNVTGYGRSIVVSAGNEGSDMVHGQYFHAEGYVATGSHHSIPFNVPEYTANYGGGNDIIGINIWYQGEDEIGIELVSPNGDTLYADTGRYRENRYFDDGAMMVDNASDGVDLNNGDHSCTILIWDYYSADPPASGQWELNVSGINIQESGHFDAWMFISQTGDTTASFAPVVASNRELVSIPGTVENVITVAAHSTKTSWRDQQGNSHAIEGAMLNDLAYFSSPGPTRDDPGYVMGLQKPDISAPGYGIISALSSDTWYISSQYHNGDGKHAIMWGTSMSAPHVAGAVALIFDKNPTLNNKEIKTILTDNAKSDVFTGSVPNYNWGYGKLDIYEAIQDVIATENPDISIVPDDFQIAIHKNQTHQEIMTVNNIGTDDLIYRLSMDLTTFSPIGSNLAASDVMQITNQKTVYQESKYLPEHVLNSTPYSLKATENLLLSHNALLTEGFEGDVPPQGWTTIHGDSATRSWQKTSNYVFSGNYGALCRWGYNLDEWLISPSLDFSGVTSPSISFWWVSSYSWHVIYNNGDLFVKVSTDGGNNWETLWTFGNIGRWQSWTWYQTVLDLSNYQDEPDVKIAFHIVADDNADIAIDHVIVNSEPWISFTPSSGRAPAGTGENVQVEFNSQNLLRGTYKSNIVVKSNDTEDPVIQVPVAMDIINNQPVVTSIPDSIAEVAETYTYQVMAEDAENDPMIYSLLSAPAWLSIDPVTGLITGIPAEEDTGSVIITLQVSDIFGANSTQIYKLYVIPSGTPLSGYITGLLTANQSPYVVEGNLTISQEQTLFIEPGVQLRFNGPYQLRVYGKLQAMGEKHNQILFTRHQPTQDSKWGGIRFIAAADTSRMEYCNIEYGFTNGSADLGNGGAIFCENSKVMVKNCLISKNFAKSGAGIYTFNSTLLVNHTTLINNESSSSGSGLYMMSTKSLVTNSLIAKNKCSGNGGGIYHSSLLPPFFAIDTSSIAKFTNCVIYGNEAVQGDGIYLSEGCVDLMNCILWANDNDDIYINSTIDTSLNVVWSDIESDWDGIGNIFQDPDFVNPGNNNYHLQTGSPCINSGNPATLYNDVDGTLNDMGIYGGSGLFATFTEYDFDTVNVNSSKTISFDLMNQRDYSFVLDTIYFKHGIHFHIAGHSRKTIPAFSTGKIAVSCSPAMSNAFTDSLILVSSDFHGATQAYIKFSGEGTGEFPGLTLKSPNGQENWGSGSKQIILWESTGPVGNVRLDYSINGGLHWKSIVISTANDGEYVWVTPQKISDNCFIRIAEAIDNDPGDTNDECFTLSDLTPPAKVVNLEATAKDSTIVLTWSPTVDNIGVDHYLLYRGTMSGFEPGDPFAVISDTFYVQTDFVLEQKYYYCIAAVDSSGNTGLYSDEVWAMVSEIENSNSFTTPYNFFLYQNYPNPFNPSTTIQYQLPKSTHIRLIIYNLMGQKIISLVDELQPAGVYHVEWDGKDIYGRPMASSVYVYAIEANDWQDVKKMVLLK